MLADLAAAGPPSRRADVAGSRVLTLDIETSPTLTYTFGMRPKWISPEKIVEPSRVLCFAAKWYDEDEVLFYSEHHDSAEVMTLAAWELLDQADILVTYNGLRFDVKRLKSMFAEADLGPPRPWKNVDLFAMAKAEWQFESMGLNHLSQRLGVGRKGEHEGFGLWRDCLAGDTAAWERMRAYNVQDVVLTEALYDRMRGWLPTHPHLGAISADERRCNQCRSTDLEQTGTYRANVIDYVLYRCRSCGANVRGGPHSRSASSRGVR